jgi:hypothetical protein
VEGREVRRERGRKVSKRRRGMMGPIKDSILENNNSSSKA